MLNEVPARRGGDRTIKKQRHVKRSETSPE